MPRGRQQGSSLARTALLLGVGGLVLWRLFGADADTARALSLVSGRRYRFNIVAHPYGDFNEWWAEANHALLESDATDIYYERSRANPEGDVFVSFTKVAPTTTTIPAHTVLYPNDPPLATATLLGGSLVPTGIIPLGAAA